MIKQLLTSRGRRRAAADRVYQTNPKPSLELPYLKAHRRCAQVLNTTKQHVHFWPSTSARCPATIFPESEGDPACREHRETGARDPPPDINSAPEATEILRCTRLFGGAIFWALASGRLTTNWH